MKVLGKKRNKVIETIEAYKCGNGYICGCYQGNAYSTVNDNCWWAEFWDV